ncbi:uncharacterized protein PpBr36_06327 [Pyricularia pennisetigena]|uniref:uncharacterized protein n=1 Tax=Pyricularia pennisetigena TaxID=1578925 RepID=UPI001153282F|nr:uncharacterized protein PpBr36_06327 [Pyricularia pennisetigena]TLS23274.1 hypothetical protein PpBr36_06327 [Pyricularia pennisetigena]
MFLSRALAATLAAVALLTQSGTAHSTDRQPLRYVSRLEEPVIHTDANSRRVHAFSSFELSFLIHNGRQKVRLSLAPNHDIISKDAVVQIMGPDGKVRAIEPLDRMEHKIYQGQAFVLRQGRNDWENVGWARVNIRRDGVHPIFEGAFRIDGDDHHIQTDETYRKTKQRADPDIEWSPEEYMVVWRDSDIGDGPHVHDGGYGPSQGELRKRDLSARSPLCSSDGLDFNADDAHPIYRGLDTRDLDSGMSVNGLPGGLVRRQDQTQMGNGAGVNLASTVGSTAGCPTTRKVALLGVATDCTYGKQFNSSMAIRQNIIAQINTASQVYESSFNISLGIQNLTISDTNCPAQATEQAPWNVDCGNGVTITDRLNLFSAWRGNFKDRNAFWTLLTTCNTDAAVGLAWLGQLCVEGSLKPGSGNTNETIAGANVVVKTSQEWQVIAHEIGHTFGAVHDCQAGTCTDGTVTKQQCCPLSGSSCDAKGQFIMNPSTGSKITNFSPCTIGNICSAIGRNSVRSSCLTSNRDVKTITGSQCGNGIVEAGEECDCGGSDGCKGNPCCDAKTCKFTSGSTCDFANEECCDRQCKFASAGTVCRASIGSCDPAETCSGTSGVCPANAFAPNGQACGEAGQNLACASGQCTSRNQQCKTLMGSLTTGNDTYACSNTGCQLSCASPEFGKDTCFTMMQNFLDGTSCQGGGKCINGACTGSSFAGEVGTWLTDNKNIVLPVACAVGGLVLLALLCCCWTAFARRKSRRLRKQKKKAAAAALAAKASSSQRKQSMVSVDEVPPPGWQPQGGAYAQNQRTMNGNLQAPPAAATRDNSRNPYNNGQWQPPQRQYTSPRYA